jgi:preprotein translocase subunit SecG
MENVILVIHLFLALAIIGLVLLQRSEGGGLGIGGGGGGLGGVASAKSMGNVLTKATSLCAMAFFCTSLILGILAGKHGQQNRSILDALDNAPVPVSQEITIEGAEEIDLPAEPPSAPVAD